MLRQRALQLVALLRKKTCTWRHPMRMRHPVLGCGCVCCVHACVFACMILYMYTCMSHVTYEWVISRINESWHACKCQITHINESCHVCMSHFTHECVTSYTHASSHAYQWAIWRVNESFHKWISHFIHARAKSHMNEPYHVLTSQVTYD